MKNILITLVLANTAVAAYCYLTPANPPGPRINMPPLQAEAITLASETVASQADVAVASTEPIASEQAASTSTLLACLRWGPLSMKDWMRVSNRFAQRGWVPTRLETQGDAATYWVYVPPSNDLEKSKLKMAQFEKLGLGPDQAFLIQDNGKWHTAISLGVFSTQDAAQKHLSALREQGIRSAIVGERDPGAQTVIAHFTSQTDALTENLTQLTRNTKTGLATVESCN